MNRAVIDAAIAYDFCIGKIRKFLLKKFLKFNLTKNSAFFMLTNAEA